MTTPWSDAALVLVGHGSATAPDASAPTRALARMIAERGFFREIACCFHKEAPFLREGLGLVRSRRVFVVPNFIGEGFYTSELIPRTMGLDGLVTIRAGRDGADRRILYTRPVGTHPLVGSLIADRALLRARALGWRAAEATLLLIGHGSGRPGGAATTPEAIARDIRVLKRFAGVTTAYLEQAPHARDWRELVPRGPVLVAPLLVSQGMHASRDVPALFGLADLDAGYTETEGFKTALCPLLGTEPAMARLVLDKVREAETLGSAA